MFPFVKVSPESSYLDYLPVVCISWGSELELFCSTRMGSVSAGPALPMTNCFHFGFRLIYQTLLTLAGVFSTYLLNVHWSAAVNFVNKNATVAFSNLLFHKVSLKPSVFVSSNISMSVIHESNLFNKSYIWRSETTVCVDNKWVWIDNVESTYM